MKVAERPGKTSQKVKSVKQSLITIVKENTTKQDRHNRIKEAAYYRAKQRNFEGGSAMQDWLLAESDIDNQSGKQRDKQ